MIGRPQRMLVERVTADGVARGYGQNYIPLRVKDKTLVRNQFVDVVLEKLYFGKETEMWAKAL